MLFTEISQRWCLSYSWKAKKNNSKETDSSESDNVCQSKDDFSAQMTNRSASAAFASPRMSKLFKKWVQQKQDIMDHLHFCTAKMNSKISLGSNLGFTMNFNRASKLAMHRESSNYLLMFVNWMFLFMYVGCTTLGLIPLTQHSTSRRCAMRYTSCVRYGRIGKAGHSRTPLRIVIKNIWIIQWFYHKMIPVGPFRYSLNTYLR